MMNHTLPKALLLALSLLAFQPCHANSTDGFLAYSKADYTTALHEWHDAAGQGVAQDYQQAAAWYRKAADQGIAQAKYSLGMLYISGQGVTRDYQQAVNWLQQATTQAYAPAQSALSELYYNGQGVTQNKPLALALLRKAAELGYLPAQNKLGAMYENGTGTAVNYIEARKWFGIAAVMGNSDATADKERLEKRMTPKQIAEAKSLARAWLVQHQ